jgi:hypothetical protein
LPDIDFARVFITFIVLFFADGARDGGTHGRPVAWRSDGSASGTWSLNWIVHADIVGTVLFLLLQSSGICR